MSLAYCPLRMSIIILNLIGALEHPLGEACKEACRTLETMKRVNIDPICMCIPQITLMFVHEEVHNDNNESFMAIHHQIVISHRWLK